MDKFKFDIKNNPSLLLGGIVFLILLLDFFVLLRPQLSVLSQVSGQVKSLRVERDGAKRDLASIDAFRKRLKVLKEKNLSVDQGMVKEEAIPAVVENLSKIAKQANVKINQIKPERDEETRVAVATEGTVYSLPITIEARCSYHQLGRLVNRIENDVLFMRIVGLEILPSTGEGMRHNIKMEVATYILKKK
ncbi:MAG: type 4a pilus biogenesis protein PilO [Candidatus Omnitrophota bacterium]